MYSLFSKRHGGNERLTEEKPRKREKRRNRKKFTSKLDLRTPLRISSTRSWDDSFNGWKWVRTRSKSHADPNNCYLEYKEEWAENERRNFTSKPLYFYCNEESLILTKVNENFVHHLKSYLKINKYIYLLTIISISLFNFSSV